MATYIILNPEIKLAKPNSQLNPDGTPQQGRKFLSCEIRPKADPFATTRKFTSFESNVVEVFSKLLPVTKGGIAPTEQPIPQEYCTIYGIFAEYRPACKFHKLHLTAHPARTRLINGNTIQIPANKVGDIVRAVDGSPIVFESLQVFCRQYLDDTTNQWVFAQGETPIEVGQRAFQSYCVPIHESDDVAVVVEPTPQQQPAQTQTFAPQPQQPTPQQQAYQNAATFQNS